MPFASISVVVAPNSPVPGSLSFKGAHEVIVVGAPALASAACKQVSAVRAVSSNAPAGQRANIGISRASGDWVVVLTGEEDLSPGWISDLDTMLAEGNFCALRIKPLEHGLPVIAAWRQAYAYGSLDGRIPNAAEAAENWLIDIFPQHRHRVLKREGSRTERASWFKAGTDISQAMHGAQSRIQPSNGPYDPQKFWEEGGRGWVKWEAFQPDEPEIRFIVERTQPKRVFEIGCGGGRNGRYFVSAERYVGLDISMPLLDRARDRQEDNGVGLICGDAVHLPVAESAFDLVFAVSTIQHVQPEKIDACIADIVRTSSRYICLIEFTEELPENGKWFAQPHMFRHNYAKLFSSHAELLHRAPTTLQVQPALKEVFLFEKRQP